MQTLGLSDSTPKPQNALQSLLWHRVAYIEDVDHLGQQGFWLCCIVAVFTL